MMDGEQQEMTQEFVAESLEMLEISEPMLISLGQNLDLAAKTEAINTVFRLFHSLKGGAGFLNLDMIKEVTHTAENLLQYFRKDPLINNDEGIDILTQCSDLIHTMLDQVQSEFHDSGFEEEGKLMIKLLEENIARISETSSPAPLTSEKQAPSIEAVASTKIDPDEQTRCDPTPQPSEEENQTKPEVSEATMSIETNMNSQNQDQRNTSEATMTTEILLESNDNKEPPSIVSESDSMGELEELLLTPEMMVSFIQEAEEQLEGTEGALLVVEQLGSDADSKEFIGTAFRNIHTLKGNSGFLGLTKIEKLAHQAEAVLDAMKEGNLQIKEEAVHLLLEVIDTLRNGIKCLSEKKDMELPNYDQLLENITAIVEGNLGEASPVQVEEPLQSTQPITTAFQVSEETFTQPKPTPAPIKNVEPIEESITEAATVIEQPPPQPTPAPIEEIAAEVATVVEQSLPQPTSTPKKKDHPTPSSKPVIPTVIKQPDIRVNLSKVEQLINLVGELVISEAMVTHNPDLDGLTLDRFVKATRQLNKNVRELQEVAMSMRMLPISGTFRKMIRVVHDVSRKIGKNVELILIGEETEVDRTVIEKIGDPLLHIIRNGVDHGIDTPEERVAAGKPEMGKIVLEARHSGNEIWIMISDDGRGLNRDKILKRAIERGIISEDDELPDSEIWKLIFSPGFSTVEQVTDLSGRGVGMDVVKRNIESLRGRIDVSSTPGEGSNFLLRIPLTLAIIEGMLIRVGTVIYVFPIHGIRESLQPQSDSIINTNDGTELVQIREDLIPVIRLHELHQLDPDSKELSDGIVVVIEDEKKQACLFVDEVVGERQVVVKGMPHYFGNIPHLAGCTILGNGDISLILDLTSLIGP